MLAMPCCSDVRTFGATEIGLPGKVCHGNNGTEQIDSCALLPDRARVCHGVQLRSRQSQAGEVCRLSALGVVQLRGPARRDGEGRDQVTVVEVPHQVRPTVPYVDAVGLRECGV